MVLGFLRENSRRILEELTLERLKFVSSSFNFETREKICKSIEENVRVISGEGIQFMGGLTNEALEDLNKVVLEQYSIVIVREITLAKQFGTKFHVGSFNSYEAQNYFIKRILPELRNYHN